MSDKQQVWGWVIPRGGKKKPVILSAHDYEEISAICEEEIHGLGYFPLFTAPPPTIPAGYKLVPIEPTETMMAHFSGVIISKLSPEKRQRELKAYRDMLDAAPEVLPNSQPTVKPLEWIEVTSWMHESKTISGRYQVTHHTNNMWATTCGNLIEVIGWYDTLEQAKSAGQAHYQQLIISQFE